MISARKFQNSCPGCRAQLLGFYDVFLQPRNGAASRAFLNGTSRPASTRTKAAFPSRRPQPNSVRPFSSSRQLFQDHTPPKPPPTEDVAPIEPEEESKELEEEVLDAETIVRQARQTFGSTLPECYLSEEEYKIYERLYGPPLRETRPEDVGITKQEQPATVLLRPTEDGHFEEVEYTIEPSPDGTEEKITIQVEPEALDTLVPLSEAQIEYLNIRANNQREYDALVKLQRDFEAASRQPLEDDVDNAAEEREIVEEEEEEFIEEEDAADAAVQENWEPSEPRQHPNTILGKFGPKPSTVYLPKQELVEPITEMLKRTDHSHILSAAEQAFGGRGLPHSPFTPVVKRAVAQKAIGLRATQHKMSEIEADTYLAIVVPPVYASVLSVLTEVRKRLGQDWIRGLLDRNEGKGPRVLDVGAGGAGLLAWQQVLQAEWVILREEGKASKPEPPGKKTAVVGSDHLRHRMSTMLHNTTFLPRLPDYLHSHANADRLLDGSADPLPRKVFDVIIMPHMLLPLEKDYRRKALLDNIWEMLNPEGGVLIVLEKGHPRGFEAVADVRDRLLSEFISPPVPQPHPEELPSENQRVREPGMIVAPCTNHHKCPMYLVPGLSPGRKDFCYFSQRFIRPPFLQKVFGATHRNHDDVDFSYVAIQRGAHPAVNDEASSPKYITGKEATDLAFKGYENTAGPAPHPLSLPRSVLPPLKRHGHVTFDLCTPTGNIERWTVPKSFSKQAYHDARKSQWGDLWALGAKSRTHRDIRLGKGAKNGELTPNLTDGGVRARETAALAGSRKKPKVVELHADPRRGLVGAKERHPGGRAPVERRTKGGRLPSRKSLIEELDTMEYKDDDSEEALQEILKKQEPRGKRKGKKGEDEDDVD
ncbi:mitochondrial small ribosomal subunit Rsm22-domain-containing protein [Rhypophila decipiens]|uniref:Mitochondrial small ribosomal subunit Rsm22-domain-containing protein n=1 Tax=Rhypophila decipiens TaxID=261697 RepID=A0AAN6YJ20_9PEZI|nr:mitochondrial small ribosomal subunit Rsm22-domain-containing protein [Rhypophila decipiens]